MKAALAVLLLAGCAALEPLPPVVSTKTVTITVPVAVPCFTEAERPKRPPPCEVSPGATTDQLAACAKIDAWALEQFATLVDALFLKCTQTTGGTPK